MCPMEELIVYSHSDSDGIPFYIGCGVPGREVEKSGRSRAWYSHVKHLNGLYGIKVLSRHHDRVAALTEEQRQIGLHRATIINGSRMPYDSLDGHIRAKRRAVGLTQADLALRAGVGLRFMRELEYGKPTLRMDSVNKVLRLFGEQLNPVRDDSCRNVPKT